MDGHVKRALYGPLESLNDTRDLTVACPAADPDSTRSSRFGSDRCN